MLTMRRLQWSLTWLVAIFGIACLASDARGDALQQPTERDRQLLLRDFTDARVLYMTTGRQAESLAPLAAVASRIEGNQAFVTDLELRQTAARSRAYRAHVLLNLRRGPEVASELLALARLDAAFTLDRDAFPQALQDLWETTKRDNVGTIAFTTPTGSVIAVDGFRLPAGTTEHPIIRGDHQVLITLPGGPERRFTVPVSAGRRQLIDVTKPVTDGDGGPWRRVYVQISFPMLLHGTATEVEFGQTIYGGTANTFRLSKKPDVFLGHYEVGGAVRVGGALGLGVTYTYSERPIVGVLSGSVRSPTSSFLRPFSGTKADVQETEKGYHLEVRAQGGGKSGEAAFFIGPSFIEISKDRASSTVSVQELPGGVFSVSMLAGPNTEHHVGLNLGFDFSGFPNRFVGVGGGIRYVYSQNQETGGVAREKRKSLLATIGLRIRL